MTRAPSVPISGASIGINRYDGRLLADFSHVRQSLGVIFTTRIGRRVFRRTFGSAVPPLLGQPLTPPTLLRFYMAIAIACYLWEPRFKVVSVNYPGTSPDTLAQGQFGVSIVGNYMPYALQGDFTVAGAPVTVII